MSTAPEANHSPRKKYDYPTSDGKPMAETDYHRDLMFALIKTLQFWFAAKPKMYVSGNLLMYYVPGNKRKHISPDVFVVRGVAKEKRLYYLVWEEGKMPALVIEITSKSIRREDIKKKFELYRDVLKVKEYFLFDPFGDYLQPQLKGYSLQKGEYVPIPLIDGRMPSKILDLHLEIADTELRLYDPASQRWLLTPEERADHAEERADHAEEEVERLRAELEKMRQQN